ncbi:stress-associated endoplasmic reticulum protein 2 isoform X1 [Oncorhynchus keta]|uniref:stress-associated endoplasmic reticulum protein 2 isoform X1 n=1 Tax=Oncorhynchus keta TaxID=8018 RepID=UPI0015F80791|nr:stress-associated endoplasmic reticulum protein 2 isoform X1 [Oncorhynchus keta]
MEAHFRPRARQQVQTEKWGLVASSSLHQNNAATSGGEVPRGAVAPGSVRLRRLWISHFSDHPEHQDGNVIQCPTRLPFPPHTPSPDLGLLATLRS